MNIPNYQNLTMPELVAIQHELAAQVITIDSFNTPLTYIAGADVSYDIKRAVHVAAVVLFEMPTLTVIETVFAQDVTTFPYIPGFLSFREVPAIIKALNTLTIKPDLIICDGQGIAHPRGLGIASHIGVLTDIPTIGCAKKRLVGHAHDVDTLRGAMQPLMYKKKMVGMVVRTKNKIKPLYISSGHKISLQTAVDIVMQTSQGYRLPEPTRLADKRVREQVKSLR